MADRAHPVWRLPFNPCSFWCNSCTFRDNCVIIGMSAICFGIANLTGIYLKPGLDHCMIWELHSDIVLTGRIKSGNNLAYHYGSKEHEAALKTCEAIYANYMYLNILFGGASIIGGAIFLYLVFMRRPYYLSLVSAVLYGICVPLIWGQFYYVFLMSGARVYIDAVHDFQMLVMWKYPECEYKTCPYKSLETHLFVHRLLSVVGGILFSLIYIFMGFAGVAYSKHVRGGFDAIIPDYVFKTDLEAPCQESLFATSGAGRYGRNRRPLVDGSGLILHRELDWIQFNIKQIRNKQAAKK